MAATAERIALGEKASPHRGRSDRGLTVRSGRCLVVGIELGDSHVGVREARDELQVSTERVDVASELAEEHILAFFELGDRSLRDLHEISQLSLCKAADPLSKLLQGHLKESLAHAVVDPLASLGGHLVS